MQTIRLTDEGTQPLFETMFRKRNLVPLIGAGFTKGAATGETSVPDGDAFKAIMLASLLSHAGPDAASLADKPFAEVAQYFLDTTFVPREVARELIRRHFIGVSLTPAQCSFLAAPWPYIYTLNIDDAIERNSRFANRVLPNRPISEAARSINCVYKVHGDAADEILYEEPSKIIFSTGQYVRSLTTNRSMLDLLKTDLTEKNTLFIGCSLSNEIDLLFALAEYKGPFIESRRSIYVTTHEPDRFGAAKLVSHGVNTVLLIDSYDSFYSALSAWGSASVATTPPLRASLKVTTNTVRRLGTDRARNLAFLLREPDAQQNSSTCLLPGYVVSRDLEDALVLSTESSPLVMIHGRRFSGRTLLLQSIAAKLAAKDVYYVDSNTRVTDEMLAELITTKNSVLLFDTNSLTAQTAYTLSKQLGTLKSNQTSAIVAVNRTEPDVQGALIRLVEDRDDYELESRFSVREMALLNGRLDAIGLTRFSARHSLLENTFQAMGRYPSARSRLADLPVLTEREAELLLVVAITDKAYSSLATVLDVRIADVFSFCNKLSPTLDLIETRRDEFADTHSRYKVVINSSTGLAMQLRSVIDGHGYRWLAERFSGIVTKLLSSPVFGDIAHTMYMFDAINQVLSQGTSGGGYRPVVRALYSELQPTLGDSPDYWLQRAKAALNIEDHENELLDGIKFATKAFHDAVRERTKDNAEFQMALLYGKLCSVTEFTKSVYVASAIKWFAQAIRNSGRNSAYVQTMLDRSSRRKGLFDQLCDYLEAGQVAVDVLSRKKDIDFLVSVRRVWNKGVHEVA